MTPGQAELLGALTILGVACLVAGGLGSLYYGGRGGEGGNVAAPRRDGAGGGNALEQLHAWPAGRPGDAEPVAHEGATEDWSPTQELATVPSVLDPVEDEETRTRREFAEAFQDINRRFLALRHLGYRDDPTSEIRLDEDLLAIIEQQRAGAR